MNVTGTKHSIVVVRFEDTEAWCDDIRSKVKHIYGVYMYDQSEVKNTGTGDDAACFYRLRWVDFQIVEGPVGPAGEELWDRIFKSTLDGVNDFDCRVELIDKIPMDGERRKVFAEGAALEPWADGYGSNNIITELVEANQGNPFF